VGGSAQMKIKHASPSEQGKVTGDFAISEAWERVYQAFADDRANVSRAELEWVRLKLRNYSQLPKYSTARFDREGVGGR
jgi:hypothetical protein